MGTTFSKVLLGAFGIICYKCSDVIFELGKKLFFKILCSEVRIVSERNPKSTYAALKELEILIDGDKLTSMKDGHKFPTFALEYGIYRVNSKSIGSFFIEYTKEAISFYTLPTVKLWPPRIIISSEKMKSYLSYSYSKHCSPTELTMSYTSDKDKWSFPIYRRPTSFRDDNLTHEMKNIIEYVNEFKTSESIYLSKGIPYRHGLMFCGCPGSGKTTLIEIIAKKYGMSIYNLNINSNDMTDITLNNLVATIQPNSILVLEEIDKQILALKSHPNSYVTLGGIISALDGPQRLSHASIIIMTANSMNFLDEIESSAMFRKGRIDKTFIFTETLNL